MFKSKHSGWTWDLKRTPFGGGGAPIQATVMPIQDRIQGKGSASPVVPPDIAKYVPGDKVNSVARQVGDSILQNTPQQIAQTPVQQTPQQPTPVSPFVQQQRQQLMQQQMPTQMRGIGGPQQPGLQSMLARILGYGGGGGGYMPQGMPPQMMQQGMPQQGYGQGMPPQGYGQQMGMPSYGRYGGQNPLGYRPDMRAAQSNTGNVAVGVAEQQRRALQAQLDAANAQIAQQSGGGGE
jgi:hypothetical protein